MFIAPQGFPVEGGHYEGVEHDVNLSAVVGPRRRINEVRISDFPACSLQPSKKEEGNVFQVNYKLVIIIFCLVTSFVLQDLRWTVLIVVDNTTGRERLIRIRLIQSST